VTRSLGKQVEELGDVVPRVRPELLRGLVVLGLFFALIITTDLFLPYTFEQSGYTVVDIKKLEENPLPLEGREISSSATITAVVDNGTFYTAEVEEGATLIFPSAIGPPSVGERVLFRGTSWIGTNGSILVHEFYALDYSSSLIRSVPGIILFIVMFFMVFKIDLRRLAFVVRRSEDA
jgi:hypothetical protein